MNKERLVELEIKISYQEIAIEELQQTVFEQHAVVEKLEKAFELLLKKIEGETDETNAIGPANEKPPHY